MKPFLSVIPAHAGIQVRPAGEGLELGPGLRRDDMIQLPLAQQRIRFMNIRKAHDFCAKLPGATRDIKWVFDDRAHPAFSVGGKMFALFSSKDDQLLDVLMFKADDARFLELTDREGFAPAGHLARAHWVRIDDVGHLSETEAKVLLTEAHHVVMTKLSKKMQREIATGVHR